MLVCVLSEKFGRKETVYTLMLSFEVSTDITVTNTTEDGQKSIETECYQRRN
jgi:hypothetical protein